MSEDKWEGLEEMLPQGYPRQGGLIIVTNKKGGSRKGRRRKDVSIQKKLFSPWYVRK